MSTGGLSPEQALQLHTLLSGIGECEPTARKLRIVAREDDDERDAPVQLAFFRCEDQAAIQNEAITWLLDDDSDGPFSYLGICDSLQYNAVQLRANVLARLESGYPLPVLRDENVIDLRTMLKESGRTVCAVGHELASRNVFVSFDEAGPQIRCRTCNALDSKTRHKRRMEAERVRLRDMQLLLFASRRGDVAA